MDPVACLATNPNRKEALNAMREWVKKGGYVPTWDEFHNYPSVTKSQFRRWCKMGLCNSW